MLECLLLACMCCCVYSSGLNYSILPFLIILPRGVEVVAVNVSVLLHLLLSSSICVFAILYVLLYLLADGVDMFAVSTAPFGALFFILHTS